jgi:hypothetical protein
VSWTAESNSSHTKLLAQCGIDIDVDLRGNTNTRSKIRGVYFRKPSDSKAIRIDIEIESIEARIEFLTNLLRIRVVRGFVRLASTTSTVTLRYWPSRTLK